MTYLVTENCINCKHGACVTVCPVDCFHEGPNFLSIDPDECIDCGVCVPECPVDAIFADSDLDEETRITWLEVNTRTSKKWPVVTDQSAIDRTGMNNDPGETSTLAHLKE